MPRGQIDPVAGTNIYAGPAETQLQLLTNIEHPSLTDRRIAAASAMTLRYTRPRSLCEPTGGWPESNGSRAKFGCLIRRPRDPLTRAYPCNGIEKRVLIVSCAASPIRNPYSEWSALCEAHPERSGTRTNRLLAAAIKYFFVLFYLLVLPTTASMAASRRSADGAAHGAKILVPRRN